jgi:hypothetical protein
MYLAIHVPMFGTAHIDSRPIECPTCPRGKEHGISDWEERDITRCNPGDELVCKRCGTKVYINWGLAEPDHFSTWLSSEHCPHRLCRLKYQQLLAQLRGGAA